MKRLGVMGAVVLGGGSLLLAQGMGQMSNGDKQFLQQAAQGDYTEIQFSQLAVQKSTNPQVESFAQRMIADHKKLDGQMKPFLDEAGVVPPTALDAEHQPKFDQLQGLTGSAFDKQYMADEDMDHHAALDLFKTEQQNTTDGRLKAKVTNAVRIISQHTEMADTISNKIGKPDNGM